MVYYTIAGKSDGFGAQYHAFMSGIAYSEHKGYIYVHTPIKLTSRNQNKNILNNFIGIIVNIYPNKDSELIVEKFSKEVHYSDKPSIYYTEKVLTQIRYYYYSVPKPIIDNIDIAIHIRRGDVNGHNEHKKRYTSNAIYKKIILSLKTKYPTYTITVFSEGQYQQFADLGLEQKDFKLNVDIYKTFHSLVRAKVLVMAKSSFSYGAGLLNENIVYYEDFWHKSLDNWININTLT